jgi:hypothetical protein
MSKINYKDLVENLATQCKTIVDNISVSKNDFLAEIVENYFIINSKGVESFVHENPTVAKFCEIENLEKLNIKNFFNSDRKGIRQRYYYLIDTSGFENWKNSILVKRSQHLQLLLLLIKYTQEQLSTRKNIYSKYNFLVVYFTNTIGFRYSYLSYDLGSNSATFSIFPKTINGTGKFGYDFYTLPKYPPTRTKNFESIYFHFFEKLDSVNENDNNFERHLYLNVVVGSEKEFKAAKIITGAYTSQSKLRESKPVATGLALLIRATETEEELKKMVINPTQSFFENYHIPFVKNYLRHKRISSGFSTLTEEIIQQQKNIDSEGHYHNFTQISKIEGLYVGWTVRSWQANFKTIDQFLLRINTSGKCTLYAYDLNKSERYGYISSITQNHIILRFSDSAKDNLESRFTFTLIVDPTTIIHDSFRLIGVIGGLESSISQPSSGKIALFKINKKIITNDDFENFKRNKEYDAVKPKGFSTHFGIKEILDKYYETIYNKYIKIIFHNSGYDTIKISNESPQWLSLFFDPRNPFDFTDSFVIRKNWLGNSGNSNKSFENIINFDGKEIKFYTLSTKFQEKFLNNENVKNLAIHCYYGFVLDNKIKIVINNTLHIDCNFQFNSETSTIIINGINNKLSFTGIIEIGDLKGQRLNFGILTIQMFENKLLFSSKTAIIIEGSQPEGNNIDFLFSKWCIEEKKTIFYPFNNEFEDLKLLKGFNKNLINSLSGNINRLLVLPQVGNVRDDYNFRYSNNRIVWFHAARDLAKSKDLKTIEHFLVNAYIHGFPDNESEISELVYFEENNPRISEIIKKIWGEKKFKV